MRLRAVLSNSPSYYPPLYRPPKRARSLLRNCRSALTALLRFRRNEAPSAIFLAAKYIYRSVLIPVMVHSALGARPFTVFRPQLIFACQPVPAAVAGLRRREIPLMPYKGAAIFLAGKFQLRKELPWREIRHLASPITLPAPEIQILDIDDIVDCGKLLSQFPLPVRTAVAYMLMELRQVVVGIIETVTVRDDGLLSFPAVLLPLPRRLVCKLLVGDKPPAEIAAERGEMSECVPVIQRRVKLAHCLPAGQSVIFR